MIELSFPSIVDVSKMQEQILLPFFVKLSRLQEQLLLNIGFESAANLDPRFHEIYEKCQDYTLTPFKAMYALYEAASYVAKAGIAGDFVQCGVWKGGTAMIVALTFLQYKGQHRHLSLYDTYEGMPETGVHDEAFDAGPFHVVMNITTRIRGGHTGVFYAPLEEVRRNMQSTGYPEDHVYLIKGRVEETLPYRAPEQISLLHLDSDSYQSTYHALTHLYPRLTKGGVLIVDDYGTWKGSRKATDQYFEENGIAMLLTPAGSPGARMGIKQ